MYPTIGALIVSRLPRNPIGWIFCGVGLLYQIQHLTLAYSDYAVSGKFPLPWGEQVAWFSTWLGFAGLILAGVFLMLLFPDGRLLSRRWRVVAWAAVLGAALAALADAFYPGRLATHGHVENPLGVKGIRFDVVANLPTDESHVDIFALSSGGSSEVYYAKTEHYIILKDVKGVPIVIYYNDEKDVFDEFVPAAEKVLQSVEWTGN